MQLELIADVGGKTAATRLHPADVARGVPPTALSRRVDGQSVGHRRQDLPNPVERVTAERLDMERPAAFGDVQVLAPVVDTWGDTSELSQWHAEHRAEDRVVRVLVAALGEHLDGLATLVLAEQSTHGDPVDLTAVDRRHEPWVIRGRFGIELEPPQRLTPHRCSRLNLLHVAPPPWSVHQESIRAGTVAALVGQRYSSSRPSIYESGMGRLTMDQDVQTWDDAASAVWLLVSSTGVQVAGTADVPGASISTDQLALIRQLTRPGHAAHRGLDDAVIRVAELTRTSTAERTRAPAAAEGTTWPAGDAVQDAPLLLRVVGGEILAWSRSSDRLVTLTDRHVDLLARIATAPAPVTADSLDDADTAALVDLLANGWVRPPIVAEASVPVTIRAASVASSEPDEPPEHVEPVADRRRTRTGTGGAAPGHAAPHPASDRPIPAQPAADHAGTVARPDLARHLRRRRGGQRPWAGDVDRRRDGSRRRTTAGAVRLPSHPNHLDRGARRHHRVGAPRCAAAVHLHLVDRGQPGSRGGGEGTVATDDRHRGRSQCPQVRRGREGLPRSLPTDRRDRPR